MTRRIPLIALFLSLVFNVVAKAQQDTTVYELGRVNLPKKFTQSVTIKAADLEKIPFTNVSDVITTWLYGYYGDKKSYVYVVDGNLNTDVNALSIFDIEEITMVQNAAVYLNGALPGQVLLVVKTKINVGKSGLNFNGQTNLVNVRGNGNSTKNFSHQYYVSAYKNTSGINAGISATLQHNTFPVNNAYAIGKPYSADRFKFNGYFNAKLGKSNTLSIAAGYIPQSDEVKVTQRSIVPAGVVTTATNGSARQNSLYANIGLASKIAPGFTNKISLGYQTQKTSINFQRDQKSDVYFAGGINTIISSDKTDSSGRANSFLINDDLSYNLRLGKLRLTPNVNFTYKGVTGTTSYSLYATFSNSPVPLSLSRDLNFKAPIALLTPSVALNYDEIVLVQGGFQKPLNSDIYSAYKVNQTDLLPFVNIGVDILKATGSANKEVTLLFSGSYARSLAISGERLISLSDQIMPFTGTTQYPYYPGTDFSQKFDQFQAGLTFGMLNNRLTASYNLQIIKTVDYALIALISPSPNPFYFYNQVGRQLYINRFEVNAEVVKNTNFNWRSALNISVFKNNYSGNNPFFPQLADIFPKKDFVTGGMVNRFNYKKLSAGADILYCFNQYRFPGTLSSIPGNKYYSVNLQNIYAGYSFKPNGLKSIEVYANSRNMLMNTNSTITDNRRFYGVGFKAEL